MSLPRRTTNIFSVRGNSGEPPEKTLHKGFVPDPPRWSSFEWPSHLGYGKPS
jgi:hypothetical protein